VRAPSIAMDAAIFSARRPRGKPSIRPYWLYKGFNARSDKEATPINFKNLSLLLTRALKT
jgi:hypothetical protein